MGAWVRWQGAGGEREAPAALVRDPARLRPLLTRACWRLYQALAEGEDYPAGLARRLGLSPQQAYYYIRQLRKAGLVEQTRTEERAGGVAKFFRAAAPALALVPTPRAASRALARVVEGAPAPLSKKAAAFLEPFVRGGALACTVAVGAPDPHGPFKARARDAHLAAELAAALALAAGRARFPLVRLDVELPPLSALDANLVIVGGPITNRLAAEVNERLGVRFSRESGDWAIHSTLSGKTYTEDAIGVIEKIPHPFFPERAVLFVAGRRNAGTRAAVLALATQKEAVFEGNAFEKDHPAKVVEGLDLDSDGKIDHVEVRE